MDNGQSGAVHRFVRVNDQTEVFRRPEEPLSHQSGDVDFDPVGSTERLVVQLGVGDLDEEIIEGELECCTPVLKFPLPVWT